jgi:uncharacterized membrane protein YoaK (UPF0700 family)
MVVHGFERAVTSRHLPTWALFAFAAGAVNACALLACGRFVSHVTGTLTRVGVDAPAALGIDYLLVLLAFVAGATTAILVVRREHDGVRSLHWLPLSISAAILTIVGVAGHGGVFGPFGGTVETSRDFVFLAILTFAMGMQNATVAAATGMAVRTTHMTGPATDLAVAFGVLLGRSTAEERSAAKRSLVLRGTKLAAFALGGAAMAALSPRLTYLALLLPAAACLGGTILSFSPVLRPHPILSEAKK